MAAHAPRRAADMALLLALGLVLLAAVATRANAHAHAEPHAHTARDSNELHPRAASRTSALARDARRPTRGPGPDRALN